MEDQGKRLLLAVAIAFALLWVWNIIFPTKQPEKKEEDKQAENATADDSSGKSDTTPGTGNGSGAGAGSGASDSTPVVEAPRGDEQIVRLEFNHFTAEFSTYGGAVKSWTLTGEQFEDRRVSPPVPLELVPTSERGSDFYMLQVALGEDELSLMRHGEWKIVDQGKDKVSFRWENDDYELTKKYSINEEFYMLDLQIDVVPKHAVKAKHELTVSMFGFQDPKEAVGGGMTRLPREWKAACDMGDSVKRKSSKDLLKESSRRKGNVRWGGFAHSFFVVAAAPERSDDRLDCDADAVEGYPGAMHVQLRYPPLVVTDAPYSRRVVSFMGPKFVRSLEQASAAAGFNAGFDDVIDLGFLGLISGPLLWLLTIFQSFVINWGVAIICVTLVIKLVLLPLTHKSIKSMKGMSKLRPQMEKLKEKYGDDKQKIQVETMNLFKTHGVNPFAGCLPMLLQMPIWFALYRMLMAAAELYQTPFIPGWIDDLTSPDPFYILPVSVMILMFFQTKLTPTTASGLQGKVLMYGMPLMFGFFSLFFPAGLTLYIFTNTALTLVHYYFVHKEDRQAARAEKLTKKSKGESDESDDSNESSDDDSSSNEDEDDSDAASKNETSKTSKQKSSKSRNGSSNDSGGTGNRPRKGSKGSRGGKKVSKKKKKKKGSGVGV